jgi:tRNA pseudouridine55 synthase
VNGLLVVDKPGGITSHDVVARLRRITGERSIGHLGTLDPMASGVLPLLLGKFTRLAQYFSSSEKSYAGTIRFGFATDTYDAEGEVAGPTCKPSLTLAEVRSEALKFLGTIEQTPPVYSAKKVAGKPAYQLARAGKEVTLKPVTIHVSAFEVTALREDEVDFQLTVSAGGYVRSIAHGLGQALGCGAHLSRLRRTRSGPFSLDDAHTIDALQVLAGDLHALEALCVHPRNILMDLPAVTADERVVGQLRNGAQANLSDFSTAPQVRVFAGQRELVCIAKRVAGTLFQPQTVLV